MNLRSLFFGSLPMIGLFMALPAHASTLSPGDLIKASGPSVYYYAQDGKRYVFPTEKTYGTWYQDFSTVKTVTDSELGSMMIGGNVTYRPGVKLVKITTDPKVYAVGPGKQLRWIKSETLAAELYGIDWAKQVNDIPDAFFVNYSMGSEIASSADYSPASVKDTHTTIQSTFTVPAPAPVPAPVPTPSPTPAETVGLTFSASKLTARPGDIITFLTYASHTSGITKIEIFFDGSLIQTCSYSPCTVEKQIPSSGTLPSYSASSMATALSTATSSKSVVVTIDSTTNGLAKLTIARPILRQGQIGSASVESDTSIAVLRTDIYRDNVSIKACASSIRQCNWSDVLTGVVGTIYEFYGKVTDTIGRTYESAKKTITISTNDSPIVTVSTEKTKIFKGETVNVTVSASDDDGLAFIEVLKDGQVIKTCNGAAPCTIATGPWMNAETLTFSGRAKDALGLVAEGQPADVVVE